MARVYTANAYGKLGSLDDGKYVLIRQHNFPDTFDETRDRLVHADHDRCIQWDYDHAYGCFKKHTGTGDMGLDHWVKSTTNEKVLAFLADILKQPPLGWTGYRIMGTVNISNGYVVWSLCLFMKHPDTDTKVYSGRNAPNVRQNGPKNSWNHYGAISAWDGNYWEHE